MHWHCFTATNLLKHWLIFQVQLRLQLVSDKQEELMLLTLAPASGGGRAVREGRIFLFHPPEFGTVWKGREWCGRGGWGEVLVPYPTGGCKYPEISSFLFLREGTGSARAQPGTPLPTFQAYIYPWAEIFLQVHQIPFVIFWDQECTLFCFPCSLTSVVSGFAFACPKDALPTAKEQVKFRVI